MYQGYQDPYYGQSPYQQGMAAQPTTPASRSPEEEDTAKNYRSIGAFGGPCEQPCNDVCQFYRHFQRAQGYATSAPIASPEERYHLELCGITRPVLVSLSVWRRSAMKILLVFFIITACLSFSAAMLDLEKAQQNFALQPMMLTYRQWSDEQVRLNNPSGFVDYTFKVFAEAQRLTMGQADVVLSYGSLGIAVLDLLAMFAVLSALYQWDQFHKSRRRLMLAWFLTVLAPFCGSIIPARSFCDWRAAEGVIRLYHSELNQLIGTDERIYQLEEACKTANDDQASGLIIDDATKTFNKVCTVIDYLPAGRVRVPTGWNIFKWKKVDFDPAHDGCRKGKQLIQQGKPDEAVAYTRKACSALDHFIKEFHDRSNGGINKEVVDLVVDRGAAISESLISLMLALFHVKTMFPAALSLAPGLLRGSVRMKMLAPRSLIPGMLVVILPWMSAPLAWCMYSIAVQVVGNVYLLLALMLSAFSPLIYFLVGWCYSLVRPMSDEETKGIVASIDIGLLLNNCCIVIMGAVYVAQVTLAVVEKANLEVGGAVLNPLKSVFSTMDGVGLTNARAGSMETEIVRMIRDQNKGNWGPFISRTVLTLVSFLFKYLRGYFLSVSAGLDWMVGEMVSIRKAEINEEWTQFYSAGQDATADEEATRLDSLVALATTGGIDSRARLKVGHARQGFEYQKRQEQLRQAAQQRSSSVPPRTR